MKNYLFAICLIVATVAIVTIFIGGDRLFVTSEFAAATDNVDPSVKEPLSLRARVDTTYTAPTGKKITVRAGENLQAAIDAARPGDLIELAAGATFTGNLLLPAKNGASYIVIRTSTPDESLPAGKRVSPSQSALMAKIVTPNSDAAIKTAPGAHHYRFIGIEFGIAAGVTLNYGVVMLGDSEQQRLEEVPRDIIIDRCYIHGNNTGQARRGVALNSAATAIIDSYIANFHGEGVDTQAVCGWNGPGPFQIINNYLEGAAENVLFGGADPSIVNLVPSDIEFRRNHVAKPLSWRKGDPAYGGTHWTVKNLFELKNAQRVVVDGNLFEYNWADAQNGFAILFTVRNQDGRSPWSVVQDVSFTNNIVRHSGSGINILGYDDAARSRQTQRIRISNNLFEDINGERWGGSGRFLQLLDATANITVDHNTVMQTSCIIMAESRAHTGFTFRDNIALHNDLGVIGADTGCGMPTLGRYFPGVLFAKNALVGGQSKSYPANNLFPESIKEVGFVDSARGNYRLTEKSRLRAAATDGKDIGADINAIEKAINF